MSRSVRVGCKVNLYLDITGVRGDGYHELDTLFHPAPEPHDVMDFHSLAPSGSAPAGPDGRPGTRVAENLWLWCSEPALEAPSNIVAKACEAFAARTGHRPGLAVHLRKGIPHGAGLGGGSADAAAMLAWLNEDAGDKALSMEELSGLAAKLGADVPFFLLGRPAWATGIGDRLVPADVDLSGLTLLVAVPRQRVNTAWAYKAWDLANRGPLPGGGASGPAGPSHEGALPLLRGRYLVNAFEPVVFREYPAIRVLKERLLALGAAAACMSGSGSAVFALFRDPARAAAAAADAGQSGSAVFASRF